MTVRLLLIVALACFVAVALAPFEWRPPRIIENGARVMPDSGISFSKPGIVWSLCSPEWLAPAIATNSITIRVTLRSFSTNQIGPARIFTVSRDERARNVTIAQQNMDLVIRLRRGMDYNGRPDYIVPAIVSDSDWHDAELIVRPTSVTIRWDNETVLEDSLPADPLQHWNPRFRLAMGNELTGNRSWLGEIAQARVEVDGKQRDCLTSSDLEAPDWYFSGLQQDYFNGLSDFSLVTFDFSDVLLNLLGFIPIGYLLAKGYRRVTVLSALGVCAAISLSVELAQLCFENRNSSVLDIGANAIGGGIGVIIARRCHFLAKILDRECKSSNG